MKTFCRISLTICVAFCVFFLGFFSNSLYVKWFYPNRSQAKELENVEETLPAESSSMEELLDEVAQVDDTIITCNTNFQVIEYDLSSDNRVEETQPLPAKYLGMDRETFSQNIEDYEISPPLEELEKGLISVEIINFSSQRITIQKNYQPPTIKDGYYLVSEDNYVIVYCTDMKTVYLYTEIPMEELPQAVQDEIIQVKYIESEANLYDFLESYSS